MSEELFKLFVAFAMFNTLLLGIANAYALSMMSTIQKSLNRISARLSNLEERIKKSEKRQDMMNNDLGKIDERLFTHQLNSKR